MRTYPTKLSTTEKGLGMRKLAFTVRAHLDIQCQAVGPEYIHTGSIIWIEQVKFKNTHVETYQYIISINKKRPWLSFLHFF